MALSMLRTSESAPTSGLAVASSRMVHPHHDLEMREPDGASPPHTPAHLMFNTSLFALGLGSLHPSLMPSWLPEVSSTAEVSATPASKRVTKRAKTIKVETIKVEPPLSPPTSGSSPQSNGSEKHQDKQFTCGICKRSFGYKHVLQNHERTHTGEKPFECSECHKRFTRDHHLKTHMRLHTGEKPYHCPHCDRSFVQVANLRRHLRVHTGEKPYACELCQSKFSDSNQLKAHMLIHNGEKPFECSSCGGSFRRRHHLLHHKCRSTPPSPSPEHDSDSDTSLTINNNNNNRRKPKDTRRVVRAASAVVTGLPEQTEPEDLSLPKSKLREQLTAERGSARPYQLPLPLHAFYASKYMHELHS